MVWLRQHGSVLESLDLEISTGRQYSDFYSSSSSDKGDTLFCEEDYRSYDMGEPDLDPRRGGLNSFSAPGQQYGAGVNNVEGNSYDAGNSAADPGPSSGARASDGDMYDDTDWFAQVTVKLPCPQLQRLTSLSLEKTAGEYTLDLKLSTNPPQQPHQHSTTSIGSAWLPKLVDLKLVRCNLASRASMENLFSKAAPQLTRLHVDQLCYPAAGPGEEQPTRQDSYPSVQALASALQPCSNLVSLHFLDRQYMMLTGGAGSLASPYASISKLQRLQELVLTWSASAPATFFPPLPCGLTHLGLITPGNYFWHDYSWEHLRPFALPQLPQLQHLQSLHLDGCILTDAMLCSMTQLQKLHLTHNTVSAATLASMTQLQELVLHSCRAVPPAQPPAAVQNALPAWRAAWEAAHATQFSGDANFLSAIGQLPKLQVLELVQLELKFPTNRWEREHGPWPGVSAQAFSALTASSQLQRLRLDGCNHKALPRGAVGYMFPPGRELKQMRSLDIAYSKCDFLPRSWRLISSDMRSIAASCPGLQCLSIQGLLKPGADAYPLLLLTECRSLSVGGLAFNNSAAGVVAQMTQLTCLSWWCAQGFNSLGVQQLTALTALQELVFVPVMQQVSEAAQDAEKSDGKSRAGLQVSSEVESDLLSMLALSSTDSRPVVLSSQGDMVSVPCNMLQLHRCPEACMMPQLRSSLPQCHVVHLACLQVNMTPGVLMQCGN
jgi:hypothetical protein